MVDIGLQRWKVGARRTGAGLAALAIVVAAAGCGAEKEAAASGGSVDRDATLKYAWQVAPNNLDPHQSGNYQVDFNYLAPVYDRLTQAIAGAEIAPMLAQSWQFAEDGLSATFTLRDDAQFHDGTPVDADAVVGSLNRARDPQRSKVANAFAMIASVEKVDAGNVRIATNRPAADLPGALSTTEAAIISPSAVNGTVDPAREDAGSGPYKFDQVRPNDRISYTRVDGYWDPEAQKAARLEVIGITDSNARLNAFRSGQVDAIAVGLDQVDDVETLTKQAQYQMISVPSAQFFAIQLDIGAPGLDNQKVRQALNYAVDREGINQALLSGKCDAQSQPLTATVAGHDASRDGLYTYDPAKARALLQETGVSGLKIKMLHVAGLSPQQEIATAVTAQFNAVGVEVDALAQSGLDVTANFRQGGFTLLNPRLPGPTAGQTLYGNYMRSFRFPTTPSQEFQDSVWASLNPNISEVERTQLLSKASGIASDSAYDVFLCSVPTVFAYSSSTVGFDALGTADFLGIGDLRYAGKASS